VVLGDNITCMESKVDEVKIKGKEYRTYKVDYSRLEKSQDHKSTAFPKVENIGNELECKAILPGGAINYTHFISIPLTIYESIRDGFSSFTEAVLLEDERPIDPLLIIPEIHIHITITMLPLPNKEDVQAASKALIRAWDKIIEKKLSPVKLHMKGIGTFGKRIDKSHLLYGKLVEDSEYEKLEKISDIIIKEMISAKVLTEKQLSHIKYIPDKGIYKVNMYHMTILNAKFKAKATKKLKEKDCLFDATVLLQYYTDYDFGSFTLERIELSNITHEAKQTGYYFCEQVVPVDAKKS